jgi:hypothetical protein
LQARIVRRLEDYASPEENPLIRAFHLGEQREVALGMDLAGCEFPGPKEIRPGTKGTPGLCAPGRPSGSLCRRPIPNRSLERGWNEALDLAKHL